MMFNRKGQNIAEYSILIALVIAAAVAMQVYVKRGIQGRMKDAVDHRPDVSLGDDAGTITFKTGQYEPYYTESNATVTSNRSYQENIGARGTTNRTGLNETTTRETGATEKVKSPTEAD